MCNNNEYNGWTNKETWLINLWRGDDPNIEKLTKQYYKKPYKLELELKEYIENLNPLANKYGLFSDLMSTVIYNVNWKELTESYISDYISENLN